MGKLYWEGLASTALHLCSIWVLVLHSSLSWPWTFSHLLAQDDGCCQSIYPCSAVQKRTKPSPSSGSIIKCKLYFICSHHPQPGLVARARAGIATDDCSAGLPSQGAGPSKAGTALCRYNAGTKALAQRNMLAMTKKRGRAAAPLRERPQCHSR